MAKLKPRLVLNILSQKKKKEEGEKEEEEEEEEEKKEQKENLAQPNQSKTQYLC